MIPPELTGWLLTGLIGRISYCTDSDGWCNLAVEDGGCGFGPDEGFRSSVVLGDVALDGRLQVDRASERSAPQPLT